jgi:hypothetical protein
MATTAPSQLDPNSVDASGISVASSAVNTAHPRAGAIYDLVTMAAAHPVWFHPLADGTYLMLNAQIWSAATPHAGTPGAYSSFTTVSVPTWAVVNGLTGTRRSVPGQPITIPMKTAVSAAKLIGGASCVPALYLLTAVTIAGAPQAVLQYFFPSSLIGGVTLGGEEVLPTVVLGGQTIVFNLGVRYIAPNLVIYGADTSGKLYAIRKLATQTGTTAANPAMGNVKGSPPVWQYYTGGGYGADPMSLAPVQTGLVSAGPLSFGISQNVALMSTVVLGGSTYTGQLWSSMAGRPWAKVGAPVPLGLSGSTYLNGGMQLMSQLSPNPVVTGPSVITGIPYCVSTKVTASGASTLANTWNLVTVSVAGVTSALL